MRIQTSSIILTCLMALAMPVPASAGAMVKPPVKQVVKQAVKQAVKPAPKATKAPAAHIPAPPHAQALAHPVSHPLAAKEGKDGPLPVKNIDEGADLPDYPAGARISIGQVQTYQTGEEDTFLDIARHFSLGYVELRAANPGVDPWAPLPGSDVTIPTFKILPRAPQQGIVVNLGEMRLYYFYEQGKPPYTFPLGIGSEGLDTPTGSTSIVRKVAGPEWHPTDRMKQIKPWLPSTVGAGPSNPLGTHAMYLGWPTFLIHGSNKPWGIGRRVSSGCMRMYPEDIIRVFGMVPVGTRVTVVDQPIKIGWLADGLYLEANPSKTQSNEIEMDGRQTVTPMTDNLRRMINHAAGAGAADRIDWSVVERAIRDRSGIPVLIAPTEGKSMPAPTAAKKKNDDKKETVIEGREKFYSGQGRLRAAPGNAASFNDN